MRTSRRLGPDQGTGSGAASEASPSSRKRASEDNPAAPDGAATPDTTAVTSKDEPVEPFTADALESSKAGSRSAAAKTALPNLNLIRRRPGPSDVLTVRVPGQPTDKEAKAAEQRSEILGLCLEALAKEDDPGRRAECRGDRDWDYGMSQRDSFLPYGPDLHSYGGDTVEGCLQFFQRLYLSRNGNDDKRATPTTALIQGCIRRALERLPRDLDIGRMDLVEALRDVLAVGCQMLRGEAHVTFLRDAAALIRERGGVVVFAEPWDETLPAPGDEGALSAWLDRGAGRGFGVCGLSARADEPERYAVFIGEDRSRGR